jgi:hypothetical protein
MVHVKKSTLPNAGKGLFTDKILLKERSFANMKVNVLPGLRLLKEMKSVKADMSILLIKIIASMLSIAKTLLVDMPTMLPA